MTVTLNGRSVEVDEGATVRAAVLASGASADERGIAVALDGRVVPRLHWDETRLFEGARVEVLRAVAGG